LIFYKVWEVAALTAHAAEAAAGNLFSNSVVLAKAGMKVPDPTHLSTIACREFLERPDSNRKTQRKTAGSDRSQMFVETGQGNSLCSSGADHRHALIRMKPGIALSDLVRDIKSDSSVFINGKKWIRGKFNWHEGFGAFSYGRSQLDAVVKYIENQEEHHSRRTFKDEYLSLLKRFKVDYDARYLFQRIEPG
jgi:hypothetical protein